MLHGFLVTITFNLRIINCSWMVRKKKAKPFRSWASGSELCKLDSSGAASLKDGELRWSEFEAGNF